MNGNPCPSGPPWSPPCDPPPIMQQAGHQWYPGVWPVREMAVFPTDWPRCCYPNGPYKPEWDGLDDASGAPDPFERLKNLHDLYICRGFTFWQGDINAQSGAAERLFGFGKISPPGDFNGDDLWTPQDWDDWWGQWSYWSQQAWVNPAVHRLTYYHGDMNSNGVLDSDDLARAIAWIQLGQWGTPPAEQYWLGDSETHRLNWDPNEKWLPCPEGSTTAASSSMGPP